MKKLIFAVILMTITWSAFAQETIFRKNAKGVLESVEFSAEDKEATIPASAEIFFKDMLKAKPTDEFRKVQRRQKQKEFVREHFEQYCNGVKIEGAGYNFHYKNWKMYFAHGHYVDVSSVNTKPSITGHEAMTRFAKYKNIPEKGIKDYMAELIIKEIPEKTDTLPALVYRVFFICGLSAKQGNRIYRRAYGKFTNDRACFHRLLGTGNICHPLFRKPTGHYTPLSGRLSSG